MMAPGAGLPDGTVTFLFTDVEGSTRLFERHADAYRAALLRHDAVLRTAVEGHSGHVFETVGDAFYAVFVRPADAVAAALKAQVDLAQEEWGELGTMQVRMGLNTGEVERRGRHYFGHTLYRCARIMATAYGGQVVLSSATSDLVRDALPDGASLRSLGTHRLKDLGEPEQIFQLVHPALRAEFPPLKSLSVLLNNLPTQVTSFVGREREKADVLALLSRSRLLTLTGMGGTGKTRLSLEVAAEALDGYPDGVWSVDLAPLADPALVPQAIASVLGVREQPGRPLSATLEDHLRPKRLLMLLDNCEHLIEACGRMADAILRTCPHVRILATSRQPLGIAGETTWRVPALSLPDPAADATAAAVVAAEAVRLFVDRARASDPGFRLTDENARAVCDICQRVDGIPLALELAAARIRALSPADIASRLEQRFAILTGGSRAALPRQRTLRALVDWSYELLDPDERTLFDRLSVFAGGWDLEATEAVCSGDPLERFAILDLLSQLVDKSLVIAEAGPGGSMGYRMLETLREYGRERLALADEAGAVRRRHAEFFVALAERAERELTGARQVEWLQRLERAHDDLRTALKWAIDGTEAAIGWRLGGALYRFWSRRGYFSEGRTRLEAVLSMAPSTMTAEEQGARAKALHGAATLAVQQGDHATARTLFEQSLAIKRELGDRSGMAATLNNLGVVARYQGDHASGRALHEESLALYRELGDKWAIANVLNNLGTVARDVDDLDAARRQLEESLALRRELADLWGIANTLENLGHIALDQGDHAMARSRYIESLTIAQQLGEKRAMAFLLEDFGALAAAEGNARLGVRLAAAAAAVRDQIGAPLPPAEAARVQRFIGPARTSLGDDAAATEAEGRALPLDAAISLALSKSPVPT